MIVETPPGWLRRIWVLVLRAAIILCEILGKLFPFLGLQSPHLGNEKWILIFPFSSPILKCWDMLARRLSEEEQPGKTEQQGKAC